MKINQHKITNSYNCIRLSFPLNRKKSFPSNDHMTKSLVVKNNTIVHIQS